MNSDLKSQLMCQIERISNDEMALLKAINFVSSLSLPRRIENANVAMNILRNRNIVVPVVCDDMFEYVKDENTIVGIKDFICEQYCYIDNETRQSIKDNYYYGISLLEETEGDIHNGLYGLFERAIEEERIRLKSSAKNFLSYGDFPLIVTTFGFPIIEKELEDLNYCPEWYKPNKRNDIPLVREGFSRRVVYHIFGGKTDMQWVYNEETLLKFVHSLHSDDYGAKGFTNYLQGHGKDKPKRILVLGSSFSDWLFRFFVYPMFGDELKDACGYWLSLDDIEKELDFFLSRNKYMGLTNLREDDRVDEVLADATPLGGARPAPPGMPMIFVSYKSENRGTMEYKAIEGAKKILERQGKVWLYTERTNIGGDAYWVHIKQAVKECDLFIPLVTMRYMEDFKTLVDWVKYAGDDIKDADGEDANDKSEIMKQNPVVREAYYAIAYRKRCVPIVILDKNSGLDQKMVEDIAKDPNDSRNLPPQIFEGHTLLPYDDHHPDFFNLPKPD